MFVKTSNFRMKNQLFTDLHQQWSTVSLTASPLLPMFCHQPRLLLVTLLLFQQYITNVYRNSGNAHNSSQARGQLNLRLIKSWGSSPTVFCFWFCLINRQSLMICQQILYLKIEIGTVSYPFLFIYSFYCIQILGLWGKVKS